MGMVGEGGSEERKGERILWEGDVEMMWERWGRDDVRGRKRVDDSGSGNGGSSGGANRWR